MSILPFEPEERLTRQAVNERVLEVKDHVEDRENPHGVAAWQIQISKETAAFLGMDPASSPTVDAALIAAVLSAGNSCMVHVTVTVGGKAAKAGILVNGVKTITGGECYTDSTGKVTGLTTSANTTVYTREYVDLPSVSKSLVTPAQGAVNVTLALAAPINNAVRTYYGTTNVAFSPYVTGVDVCCVGGGGGGGGVYCEYDFSATNSKRGSNSGGGGGGHIAHGYGIAVTKNESYRLIVGNGGAAGGIGVGRGQGSAGRSGGESSFMGVSALGGDGGGWGEGKPGAGGRGNGSGGGSWSNGSNSTEGFIFGDASLGSAGGGGGSGQTTGSGGAQPSGGTPYGGKGAWLDLNTEAKNGSTSGTGPGGGGGGGCVGAIVANNSGRSVVVPASAGRNGAVYIRCHIG